MTSLISSLHTKVLENKTVALFYLTMTTAVHNYITVFEVKELFVLFQNI